MNRTSITAVASSLSLGLAMGAFAASTVNSGRADSLHASSQSSKPAQVTTAMAAAPKGTTTTLRGPDKTGQPNQSCEDLGNQPGRSMSAPGSAFNPDGKAGSVYAGEQPQNSRNTASVSQYDVACARPSK